MLRDRPVIFWYNISDTKSEDTFPLRIFHNLENSSESWHRLYFRRFMEDKIFNFMLYGSGFIYSFHLRASNIIFIFSRGRGWGCRGLWGGGGVGWEVPARVSMAQKSGK
jgi:hypothetical protein